MLTSKADVATGFAFLVRLMPHRFVLILLRNFPPGKEQRVADYAEGAQFESWLAQVHGNLFARLDIAVWPALSRAPDTRTGHWKSGLALLGLLIPLGILADVLFGGAPTLVMTGGISVVAAMIWTAARIWQTETFH